MPCLPNPYGDSFDPRTQKEIKGRASLSDWRYLKSLYPMLDGVFSSLLSTCFHRFIQHYRTLEKENGQPLEPAWYPGCPGYLILDLTLARCNFDDVADLRRELARVTAECISLRHELQRASVGRASGDVPGVHDLGATGSVCPEVLSPEKLGPNPESRTERGCSEAGSD